MSFQVELDTPQPSQLYIDARRIDSALEWFDFEEPNYDPVPGIFLDDELVITDGHTRAFLTLLSGANSLKVIQDPEKSELNLPLYRECVEWCGDESIDQINDLVGRVVNHSVFMENWVTRCENSDLSTPN